MTYKGDIQYVNFYVDGSSAKKIAPVEKVRKATLPKPKKRKSMVVYVDPIAVLGSVVAICLLVMMLVGLSTLQQEKTQAETMDHYLTHLEKKNQELTKTYEDGYDLEEVERTALALGMVPENEVPHKVVYIPAEEVPEQPQKVTLLARITTVFADLIA